MLDGCRGELVIGTLWWRWLFPSLFLLLTVLAIIVNMVQGGGLYGFDGIRRTAELMAEAFTEEKDTEDLVVRKGWGCESCI